MINYPFQALKCCIMKAIRQLDNFNHINQRIVDQILIWASHKGN